MKAVVAALAATALASACSGGGSPFGAPVPSTTAPGTTASAVTTSTPSTTVTVAGVTAGLAGDAAGLAAQLIAAERTIRDPDAAPDAIAAGGRTQQLAYRRLSQEPALAEPVGDAIPGDLRGAFDANLAAATARQRAAAAKPAASPPRPPSPTLPAWHIRAPKPAAELLGYYKEAEAATGVSWAYLAAINLVETRMGRIVGVSSAGAEGPMQFLPGTWARWGQGDVWDDHDAIRAAARYLAASGAPGDMTAAILEYNPNDVYLEMVTSYAAAMTADERAYFGYHAWEVFYTTSAGEVRLPEGYAADAPVDAGAYLAAHPEDRA
jgi:membrane-bound lytic murein transglycosylase B